MQSSVKHYIALIWYLSGYFMAFPKPHLQSDNNFHVQGFATSFILCSLYLRQYSLFRIVYLLLFVIFSFLLLFIRYFVSYLYYSYISYRICIYLLVLLVVICIYSLSIVHQFWLISTFTTAIIDIYLLSFIYFHHLIPYFRFPIFFASISQ